MKTHWSVLVVDMYHYEDDENTLIKGFASLEQAREYARRRTRDSLEELRPTTSDPSDLRKQWFAFGEDCIVLTDSYCGAHELDYFIQHPATAEERDWAALTPQ